VLSGGNIDIGLIPNLVRRNETNEGRRLTIFVRLPDRPGSLARLVDVCAAQEANVIGVKLHPRETGIQVVLEVKSEAHSQVVIHALESSGFQLH
jgi:threonine dehydratase